MTDPHTGPEIAAALHARCTEDLGYWRSFEPGAFLAPLGTAWSPADNVRHLTKSMRAVSVGLRAPRLALWLRFGTARAPSRGYAEMRETYRARLAQGADAGRFAPSPMRPVAAAAAERDRVLELHVAAVAEVAALIARWSERALDRRRLPHPLLGKLTVREMLLFTLYHNRHHVDVVRRRSGVGA